MATNSKVTSPYCYGQERWVIENSNIGVPKLKELQSEKIGQKISSIRSEMASISSNNNFTYSKNLVLGDVKKMTPSEYKEYQSKWKGYQRLQEQQNRLTLMNKECKLLEQARRVRGAEREALLEQAQQVRHPQESELEKLLRKRKFDPTHHFDYCDSRQGRVYNFFKKFGKRVGKFLKFIK